MPFRNPDTVFKLFISQGLTKTMKLLFKMAAVALAFTVHLSIAVAAENWPTYSNNSPHTKELNDRFAGKSGIFHDTSYKDYLQKYSSKGDYLRWGTWSRYSDDGKSQISDGETVTSKEGLPQIRDGDNIYWNPVTLSHYALAMHGKYVNGKKGALKHFFAAADKLIELQALDGGFHYPSRKHRHNALPDGWISAMAQGNALSVFSRALQLKGDQKYRKAGELAFENLMTQVKDGGARTSMAYLDPSLTDYVFFPEYPNTPIDYTLNGYMFTLIGIYDWSNADSKSKKQASIAFHDGMKTLVKILPYYDVDGFSTYDLAHIILDLPPYVAPSYLGIHVYLLHALDSISPSDPIKFYEQKWAAKIDQMNRSLRFTTIDIKQPSPQPSNTKIEIVVKSAGGTNEAKEYKLDVKHNGTWTTVSDYSKNETLNWTPDKPGEYTLGFFAKNADSTDDYDNFRYQTFIIK